jgi:hypothetical protein
MLPIRCHHLKTYESFGFGAAINCMLPLVNVADEPYDDRSAYDVTTSGVSSESPGAGAFTPYTGRRFAATAPIPPFAELFVSPTCLEPGRGRHLATIAELWTIAASHLALNFQSPQLTTLSFGSLLSRPTMASHTLRPERPTRQYL